MEKEPQKEGIYGIFFFIFYVRFDSGKFPMKRNYINNEKYQKYMTKVK